MNQLFIHPSSLIWNREHFTEHPHLYDSIIEGVIDILFKEEIGECEFVLLEQFTYEILDHFPFVEIDNGHHKSKVDFVTQVTSAVSKWMSYGVTAESIDQTALLGNIHSVPSLLTMEEENIKKLNNQSNSWMFNKKEIATIAFNSQGISNLTLIKINNEYKEEEKDCRSILNDTIAFNNYLQSKKLICQFSKKHHPIHGWGSKMPHENLEAMQNLLDKSISEPGNEARIRYAFCQKEKVFYAFRVTNGKVFHPYPVTKEEVPNSLIQQLN